MSCNLTAWQAFGHDAGKSAKRLRTSCCLIWRQSYMFFVRHRCDWSHIGDVGHILGGHIDHWHVIIIGSFRVWRFEVWSLGHGCLAALRDWAQERSGATLAVSQPWITHFCLQVSIWLSNLVHVFQSAICNSTLSCNKSQNILCPVCLIVSTAIKFCQVHFLYIIYRPSFFRFHLFVFIVVVVVVEVVAAVVVVNIQ